MTQRLDGRAWWFPVAFTVHNLEEALGLPAWSREAGAFHAPVGDVEFRFAVAVLTVAGWGLTWVALRRGGRWVPALAGMWTAMLLNVVAPHLAATVALGRYAPGLGTALACTGPCTAWLLWRGLTRGAFTRRQWAVGAAVMVPLMAASVPALLAVGRVVEAGRLG